MDGRPKKSSLMAREEIRAMGTTSVKMLFDLFNQAEEGYEAEKQNKFGKPYEYLKIKADIAKALFGKEYPQLKAIMLSLDSGEKPKFDSSDPKQVIQALTSDPFFTKGQREELLRELQGKDITPAIELPVGQMNEEKKRNEE